MEILVFKTNLRYKKQVQQLLAHMNTLQGVIKWNVDLHDKDSILRIVANNLSAQHVEKSLQHAGYRCEELPD